MHAAQETGYIQVWLEVGLPEPQIQDALPPLRGLRGPWTHNSQQRGPPHRSLSRRMRARSTSGAILWHSATAATEVGTIKNSFIFFCGHPASRYSGNPRTILGGKAEGEKNLDHFFVLVGFQSPRAPKLRKSESLVYLSYPDCQPIPPSRASLRLRIHLA